MVDAVDHDLWYENSCWDPALPSLALSVMTRMCSQVITLHHWLGCPVSLQTIHTELLWK